MAHYNNLGGKEANNHCIITTICGDVKGSVKQRPVYRNLCLLSVIFGFSVGLLLGILLPFVYLKDTPKNSTYPSNYVNTSAAIRTIFLNNSYGNKNYTKQDSNVHPTVSFVDRFNNYPDDKLIENGIYWGSKIEKSLPEGYLEKKHESWTNYVQTGIAVKLEGGCGRMQNRLVTFQDGLQGCVRYRQNTDQIQGELFSFYLAQILKLSNLAPSTVSTVNLKSPLWQNLATEIAAAQWNSNRPVVLTQYISDLDSANIPSVFKPVERHLNKYDVLNMTGNNVNVLDNGIVIKNLVELAQWSDLIIFDYLTANLDRIVNNLYNYQWNVNIMDAPAHNLAKKVDTNLLIFLDNESGLLHGYRLLKKYEIYHSVLLDNLCLFRKQTVDIIKDLRNNKNVGTLLRNMFEERNDPQVKDVLPTLPDKSIKILNERIEKVYNQIIKCESMYSEGNQT
ncbi:hypothetical protein ILUMI_22816 [Ignelater luminosus]|uniref:Uncharacterized protein n=1 Tax=Ignelater luminosus TaxID=2038154 RepID=A0A8K0CD59_IGNLU|nr:hypothetical protein ILUMI_22816 [Ignelater luminosus]